MHFSFEKTFLGERGFLAALVSCQVIDFAFVWDILTYTVRVIRWQQIFCEKIAVFLEDTVEEFICIFLEDLSWRILIIVRD